jgi:hypothetical protein
VQTTNHITKSQITNDKSQITNRRTTITTNRKTTITTNRKTTITTNRKTTITANRTTHNSELKYVQIETQTTNRSADQCRNCNKLSELQKLSKSMEILNARESNLPFHSSSCFFGALSGMSIKHLREGAKRCWLVW